MLRCDLEKLVVVSKKDVQDMGFRNQKEFYFSVLLYNSSLEEANRKILTREMCSFYCRPFNEYHMRIFQKEVCEVLMYFYQNVLEHYDEIYRVYPNFDDFIKSIENAPDVFDRTSQRWNRTYKRYECYEEHDLVNKVNLEELDYISDEDAKLCGCFTAKDFYIWLLVNCGDVQAINQQIHAVKSGLAGRRDTGKIQFDYRFQEARVGYSDQRMSLDTVIRNYDKIKEMYPEFDEFIASREKDSSGNPSLV